MEKNELFPVFLKISELDLLLVGGGNVGAEKLGALLKNCSGARITVVADRFSDEVMELARLHPNIRLDERKFSFDDLLGKDLVFLATDDQELHRGIVKETGKLRILTNVADTPHLCDFYLGSIVQKGNLKIGISTNGKSPTMAKRIREFLDDIIPEHIDGLLENLHRYRLTLKADFRKKVEILNEFTRPFLEKTNQ